MEEDRVAALTLLEGYGPLKAGRLRRAGVRSTRRLFEQCGTEEGRRQLAEQTGLPLETIDRLARRADLYRITGIGREYADLLAAVGANTVARLADRDPDELRRQMEVRNRDEQLVRCLPSEGKVHHWVEQARSMVRT
jgi:predicted flap endonuclease-1-like 5' DNA nuclease